MRFKEISIDNVENSMLDFLVLSLSRSGSTWCSNWLSTDTTHCLHDPLSYRTLTDLEMLHFPGKQVGAACTFLWMYPQWCQQHAKHLIILDRPINQIQASLKRIGMDALPEAMIKKFQAMPGHRVPYEQLFDPKFAMAIWEYLHIHAPFDEERHKLLREMTINPNFAQWRPDKKIIQELLQHLKA
jgi:hypothetical protein